MEGEESLKTGKGTLQPGRRGGEGKIGQEDGQKEERNESEICRKYTRKCGSRHQIVEERTASISLAPIMTAGIEFTILLLYY